MTDVHAEDPFLNVVKASAFLGTIGITMSPRTVTRLAAKGKLPFVKLAGNRKRVIKQSVLRRWADAQQAAAEKMLAQEAGRGGARR